MHSVFRIQTQNVHFMKTKITLQKQFNKFTKITVSEMMFDTIIRCNTKIL